MMQDAGHQGDSSTTFLLVFGVQCISDDVGWSIQNMGAMATKQATSTKKKKKKKKKGKGQEDKEDKEGEVLQFLCFLYFKSLQ